MDDPAVDTRVRVHVGTMGNVKTGDVPRGTRVEDAFARFGFTQLQTFKIRGWTRAGRRMVDSSKDDAIEEDMTLLLLRPIIGRAPVAEQLE